jgi:hypothetical protein
MKGVQRGRCSVKAAIGCGNRREDEMYTIEVVYYFDGGKDRKRFL